MTEPGSPRPPTWWTCPRGRREPGTNAWGFITVDTERGIVYIPLGCPTSDFYGADRPGNGLYGNTLVALDAYRARFESVPDTLSNAILLGSLLVPLGQLPPTGRQADDYEGGRRAPAGPRLGELPLARRDIEWLRQILSLQRRLRDHTSRARHTAHRSVFRDAVTWFEIHGGSPEAATRWQAMLADVGTQPDTTSAEVYPELSSYRRRRRRRRRRFRPAPQ